MMISIVILICDKDWEYLSECLYYIETNIHIPFEVIVMDNRTVNTPIECYSKIKYKIISMNGNKRQLWARKESIKYCSGDYIWFVDVDDNVLEVNNCNFTEDLIIFNYYNYYNGTKFISNNNPENSPLFSCDFLDKVYLSLWNKWIKRDLAKKIYSLVPKIIVGGLEDTIALCLCMKYGKTYKYIDLPLYENILIRGCSSIIRPLNSYDEFYNVFVGKKEVYSLFNSLFTKTELDTIKVANDENFFKKDLEYMLERLFSIKNLPQEELLKAKEELIGVYGDLVNNYF